MTPDLFEDDAVDPVAMPLAPGAVLLRRVARAVETPLWGGVLQVIAAAPLRQMVTPGGLRMSVAMTNCGTLAGSPIAAAIATTGAIR